MIALRATNRGFVFDATSAASNPTDICLSHPWRLPAGSAIRKAIGRRRFAPVHKPARNYPFHLRKPGRYRKPHTMPAQRKRRAVFTPIPVALVVPASPCCNSYRPILIPAAKSTAGHHRQRQDIKGKYERKNPHPHKDSKPLRLGPFCCL